jgi:hypothetical protein
VALGKAFWVGAEGSAYKEDGTKFGSNTAPEIWFQIWFHPCLFLPTFAYCDRLEVTETKELRLSTVNQ